jgi:hypothetical protein
MVNKLIASCFITILSAGVHTTTSAQQGYVVFGDKNDMCKNTGLCDVQVDAFTKDRNDGAGPVQSTKATFQAFDNRNGTYSLVMTIDMAAVYAYDKYAYGLLKKGYAKFISGRVPAAVIDNVVPPRDDFDMQNYTLVSFGPPLPDNPAGTHQFRRLFLGIQEGAFPVAAATGMPIPTTATQKSQTRSHQGHRLPPHTHHRRR